jgi:tRNA-dihydrouridine synthase B
MTQLNFPVKDSFVLAPMDELNFPAFRLFCKELGADIIYTHMYDVNVIAKMTKEEVKKYLAIQENERPIIVQLIGRDLDKIKKSIRLVEDFCDAIDLNCGCIEKKYLERDCGAALLKDSEKLGKIIRAMVDTSKKPITVKIRIGWDAQSINAVKIAKSLEENGASLIAVHGRTAEQKYKGKANRVIMKQVKGAVSIPVIANGDLKSKEEGIELMKQSNCDGVMIGREAKYAPWVFTGKQQTNQSIKKHLLRFIDLCKDYPPHITIKFVQDQVFRMTRDFKTETNKREVKSFPTLIGIRRFIEELE